MPPSQPPTAKKASLSPDRIKAKVTAQEIVSWLKRQKPDSHNFAPLLGLMEALSRRLVSLGDTSLVQQADRLRAAASEPAPVADLLALATALRDALSINAGPLTQPPPAPKAPSPAPPPLPRAPTSPSGQNNRIHFDALQSEIDAAFAESLADATNEPVSSGRQPTAADVFSSFDDINLRWMAADDLQGFDDALAKATEPSGLISVAAISATDNARVDKELLPQSLEQRFEDSGLFHIFVDDEAFVDPIDIDIDIDTAPPVKLSAAEQAYQGFVGHAQRILMRLFDSLDLAMLAEQSAEYLDVFRQLNRLARVLDHVELDKQIALTVYLQRLLPVTFPSRAEPQDPLPMPVVTPEACAAFIGNQTDFLNALVYFVSYLIHEIPGLQRDRFERALIKLYTGLNLPPGDPSPQAPLGAYAAEAHLQLTSRARAHLTQTFETKLNTMLDAVEAAALKGRISGYREAAHAMLDCLRQASEHDVGEELLATCSEVLGHLESLRSLDRPSAEWNTHIASLCTQLTSLLPDFSGQAIVARATQLIESFSFNERVQTGKYTSAESSVDADTTFAHNWQRFRTKADEILVQVLASGDEYGDALGHLHRLRTLAATHDIVLLERLLGTLRQHWERSPLACSQVLGDLAASIQALPQQGAKVAQLEALARSIVSDLIQRRSHESAPPKAMTDAFEAGVIRLCAKVQHLHDDLEHMSHPAPTLTKILDAAEEAERLGLRGLGLACEVLGELLPQLNHSTSQTIRHAIAQARDWLRALLECTRREVQEIESGRAPAFPENVRFDYWLSPAEKGTQQDLAFSRALSARLSPLLVKLADTWTQGFATHSTAVNEYLSLLDEVHQAVAYWGQVHLGAKVITHQQQIKESVHQPTALPAAKRQLTTLLDELRSALQAGDTPADNPAAQAFVSASMHWLAELAQTLDAPAHKSAWLDSLHEAIEVLAPLAREGACVPQIALVCELRFLLRQAEIPKATPQARLETLLYWYMRVITALYPHWMQSDGRPQPRTQMLYTPRVPANEIAEMHRLLSELQSNLSLSPTEALRLENTTAYLHTLLQPTTLIEQMTRQSSARALLLGKKLSVAWQLDDSALQGKDRLAAYVDTHQEALSRIFAAFEVVIQAIIDHAFPATVESGHIEVTLALESKQIAGAVWHNGTDVTRATIQDALVSTGFAPAADDNLFELLQQAPAAVRTLPCGPSLSIAECVIKQSKGHIDIVSSDSDTILQFFVPCIT